MSDSSLSVRSPAEVPALDALAAGLVPALPAAFLAGRDLDLLEPLRILAPDNLPEEPSPAVDREAIAEALAVANAAYSHPGAERLAARLADPATTVVVTGQQTGLFGGPLYTLTKAVAASLWAERLTAAGRPAVAVFWMATEDHDYREVARTTVLTPGGPLAIDLGEDPTPLRPVGVRSLGPAVEVALDRLREASPGDRFGAWIDQLAAWYRPNARFGEAFARLFAHLLGERCPLLLDAMLPAVKEAERPWLEKIVARHDDLVEAYAERDRRIVDAGHDLQVAPQPGASPLFYLHLGHHLGLQGMERRRLEIDGDRITLRGVADFARDRDWLESAIAENPAVVSPGVLARPAIQDAVLGTSLQVLGPGEASYMPQVAPLYDLLGITAPEISIRPQAVVLGAKEIEKAQKTGIALADFVGPELDLDRLLAGDRGAELVTGTGGVAGSIAEQLAALETQALAIDPNLAGPLAKTRQQIDRALETFAGKVDKAAAGRNQIARQRADAIRQACRPDGKLQERVISTAHFFGKYGPAFVEAFFDQLDLDPRRLSVITPGETS